MKKEIPRRALYPTGEVQTLLCCSKAFLKKEMDSGRIGYVLRNHIRYVPATAIREYIESLSGGK